MRSLICSLGKFLPIKKNLPIKRAKKILFFRTGGIGDVIMTTPLIREISKHTGAELYYLVGKHSAGVLKNNPHINVIPFDESVIFGKDVLKLASLRKKIIRENYEIVFILDKSYLANLFFLTTNIPVRIGFDRFEEGFPNTHNIIYDQKTHDILSYMKLTKFLGIKPESHKTEVYLTKQDNNFADEFYKRNNIKNAIIIAPGGANNPGQKLDLKLWPKENYRKLAEQLSKKEELILLGGANDEVIGKYVSQGLKVHNLIGKTSLQESAAIMKKAKLVICNDSGPMHIAGAVNEKVLSLFFITNPKVLAPLNKKSKYIWKEEKACFDIYGDYSSCKGDENQKISVEEVYEQSKNMV